MLSNRSDQDRRSRVLVTGGLGGIGQACAKRFRVSGCDVLTLDMKEPADVVVDIGDVGATMTAVAAAGTVDVLVHCAAVIGPNKPLVDVQQNEWDATMRANLRGTFSLMKAVVPGMVERGWGRIVNIASLSGLEGSPNLATYSASKAGVVAMTKSLGKEVAGTGVLVNAIAPTVVATPMVKAADPATVDYLVQRIPLGRLAEPSEVAELAVWLGSALCSFSTGAVYDISGGKAVY